MNPFSLGKQPMNRPTAPGRCLPGKNGYRPPRRWHAAWPRLAASVSVVLADATAFAEPAPLPDFEEKPPVDNIGNRGQLIFGAERITGLAWERLSEQFVDANGETLAEYSSDVFDAAAFGGGAGTTALVPRLGLDFFLLDGASIGIVGMVVRASGSSRFNVGQIEQPVTQPPTH